MTANSMFIFRIRFNTQHEHTPGLCWRVLVNEEELLVADIEIHGLTVKTASHVLDTGEQKWSIVCESDTYFLADDGVLHIGVV